MTKESTRGTGTSTRLMGNVINLVCSSHVAVAYIMYPSRGLANIFSNRMHDALRALGIGNPEARIKCYNEVPRGVNFAGINNVLFFDNHF